MTGTHLALLRDLPEVSCAINHTALPIDCENVSKAQFTGIVIRVADSLSTLVSHASMPRRKARGRNLGIFRHPFLSPVEGDSTFSRPMIAVCINEKRHLDVRKA